MSCPLSPALITLVVTSDVAMARREIDRGGLLPCNFNAFIQSGFRDFGYTCLAHEKPESSVELAFFNVAASDLSRLPISVMTPELLVQETFDRLHRAGDQSVNRVWLARQCNPKSSPSGHEWGIHPGLVGVALPDEMFNHFMSEAALRAAPADTDQPDQPDDAEAAPGQGG